MAYKHLLRTPHNISETVWWYEDNGGIDIIVHPQPSCQHIHITWKALRGALKRKDHK